MTDSQLFDAFGNTVSRTGTTPTPFGFVGAKQYQSDSDSGLQLLGHRYYDPSTGRFLSSDPAKAGTSWYAYCDNNPLTSTDSQGLDKTKTYGDITFIFDDNGSLIGSMPSGGQTGGNSTGSSQTGGSSSSHSGSGGSITGGINDVGGHPSGNFGATYNFPGGSITGSATNIGTANTSGTFGGSYKFPGGSINGSANNIGTSNTSGSLGATLTDPPKFFNASMSAYRKADKRSNSEGKQFDPVLVPYQQPFQITQAYLEQTHR